MLNQKEFCYNSAKLSPSATQSEPKRGKNVTFSCSEQTRPKYVENYNIIVVFCQDLVQGSICFFNFMLKQTMLKQKQFCYNCAMLSPDDI